MTQEIKNDPQYQKQMDMMFYKHHWMTLRVFLIIGGTLLVCAGGGYLLDMALGTKPRFLIVGTMLAFVVGHGLTLIIFRNLTR